jgi:hypothetical protein
VPNQENTMNKITTEGTTLTASAAQPGRIYKVGEGVYSGQVVMRTSDGETFVDLADGELFRLSGDIDLIELGTVTITVEAK